MKPILFALVFVLLSLGISSALAQDGSGIGTTGSADGYSCWACPVCGYVVQLEVPVGTNARTYSTTLSQVATLDPNDPSWYCPSCYYYYGGTLTFAGNFVLVPCQSTGYGQNTGYSQNAGSGQNTGYSQGSSQGQGLQSGFGQQSGLGQSNLGEDSRSGAQTGDESENLEKLQGKVLMIVCPQDFQKTELDVPRSYFEKRGLEVVTASNESEAESMDGEAIETDLTLSQVKASDYSAIIFVGGDGIELQKVYEDPEFLAVAKKAGSSGMLIGAICLGPNIIANAGLLQGKKATGSDTDYLASKGADVVYDPVVRDGNIITGSGPDASLEFAEEVALAISESSQSTVLSQSTAQSTAQSTGDISSENSTSASRLPFSGSLENSQPSGLTGSGQSSSEQSSSSDASAAQSSGLQEAYKCSICGYVYDPAEGDPEQGIAPGTPFENLPSSWKCPLCGAGKDEFSSDA